MNKKFCIESVMLSKKKILKKSLDLSNKTKTLYIILIILYNIKCFNRYNYFRKTIIYTKIIKYIIYERI